MTYIIETWDKKDHQYLRNQLLIKHNNYLNQQLHAIVASGDKFDEINGVTTGNFYILNVETRAQAQQFIQADPLFLEGLLQKVKIESWRMTCSNSSI